MLHAHCPPTIHGKKVLVLFLRQSANCLERISNIFIDNLQHTGFYKIISPYGYTSNVNAWQDWNSAFMFIPVITLI